jgi:nucleotide-binding universal stress UspA family protein
VSDAFARIVCGVDGSEAGVVAVRQARSLATGESLVVVVAVSEGDRAVHAGLFAGTAGDELDAEAQAALDEVGSAAGDARLRLIRGRPEETLVAVAKEERATLVAVGSHETSRRRGIVLGSVATRLVHDAPCSVLIARAAKNGDRFPRRIVVGVDGSTASLEAAHVARELATRVGAEVECLAATGASDEIDTAELERSGLQLRRVEEKALPALVAASQEADLLVVASRGLRGLRALGSVGERLAHEAHCSLLVHRPPAG